MRSKINLVGELIGLDLGMSRTGVARINTLARIAEALEPISMDDAFLDTVKKVADSAQAVCIVAGIPRGLNGQDTDQTQWAQSMIAQLKSAVGVPVFSIDEAGTTKAAEMRALDGQSVDSVAACIILEDFIAEALRGNVEDVHVSS